MENYISWGYFTDEDKVGFFDANMLDLYRLDENGIENKGWTKNIWRMVRNIIR